MDRLVRWLFGGFNGGAVIGTCVGLPLGLSILFVDVNAIRAPFYEAIAAAIPVLLLSVVLLIRGEGSAVDQLEEPRRERRAEAERILGEVQHQAVGVKEIQGWTTGEGAEAERTERLLERLRGSEGRLQLLIDRFAIRASLMPILGLLYISFGVGALGEAAALAALGTGHSNMATYLFTVLGVGFLLVFMVILERNAITRASSYRRIEDELEKEFASQKEMEDAETLIGQQRAVRA